MKRWHGCYSDSWAKILTDESFTHPAKMARGLLTRIIDYGLQRRWWAPGDLIADPFGGIGSTGIMCSYRGLRSISVELEPRFVVMAHANFDLHRAKWQALGAPHPVMLQGDSREFASLVGQVAGAITSPPYSDSNQDYKNAFSYIKGARDYSKENSAKGQYGSTPGNIGNLKAGDVDACITSPPYAGAETADSNSKRQAQAGYWAKSTNGKLTGNYSMADYGSTLGQIGNLKAGDVDACITSPPYEGCITDRDRTGETYYGSKSDEYKTPGRAAIQRRYGTMGGQIGNTNGQSYWQAVAQVYAEVYQVLKPGGVMVLVVKDYVKGGKRVPLCDDTMRLLVALGFKPVERIRAMLVSETVENTLFEGPVVKRKERKSFFRRLSEARGSPRIDWEEVLVVKKTG